MTRAEREQRAADRLAEAFLRWVEANDQRHDEPARFRGACESLANRYADFALAKVPQEVTT